MRGVRAALGVLISAGILLALALGVSRVRLVPAAAEEEPNSDRGRVHATDREFASSAESMGEFRLGKLAERVIEGHRRRSEATEAVRSSGGHFRLAVQPLHGSG